MALVCSVVCSSRGGVPWCPLVAGGQAFGDSGPVIGRLWSSGGVFPPFCPLCCFVCGVLPANMALFRVLRAFLARFYGVCVGLCCLGALRGLCGFCARVELGGLEARSVFASILSVFLLLCLSFVLLSLCLLSFLCSLPIFCGFTFVVLCWSSCMPCLFLCACGFCVFLFPFGLYAKRKGAKVCPLRPRLSYCVCSDSCTVIEKLPRCVFGFFQFVRLIMPTNTTGVGRFTRFYFDFLRHYIDITYNPPAFLK